MAENIIKSAELIYLWLIFLPMTQSNLCAVEWESGRMSAMQFQRGVCLNRCNGSEFIETHSCLDMICFPCNCQRPQCEITSTCCPDYDPAEERCDFLKPDYYYDNSQGDPPGFAPVYDEPPPDLPGDLDLSPTTHDLSLQIPVSFGSHTTKPPISRQVESESSPPFEDEDFSQPHSPPPVLDAEGMSKSCNGPCFYEDILNPGEDIQVSEQEKLSVSKRSSSVKESINTKFRGECEIHGTQANQFICIRSCAEGFQDSEVQIQCEAEPSPMDVEYFNHVTDNVTGVTYCNKFCARCNSVTQVGQQLTLRKIAI